jgi:ribose 5-phosphate isomerase A
MGLKQRAAVAAADLVENGMVLGLGTGSTASLILRELGRRLAGGKLRGIRGVPTSQRTARLAEEVGIPLRSLEEVNEVELTLDGADEVDPEWNLIKGGGGSLLREKIVAQISRVEAIVVDESKLVQHLGERFALPLEVVPFGWKTHDAFLRSLGGEPELRRNPDESPSLTDEGNYTIDVRFAGGELAKPREIDAALRSRTGIIETGLFLGLTSTLVVARSDGVEVLRARG